MATELRKAFSRTLPVMAGYIFLGTAYGISMRSKGFGIGLTVQRHNIMTAGDGFPTD